MGKKQILKEGTGMRKRPRWQLLTAAVGAFAIIITGSAIGAGAVTDQRAQNLRVIIAGEPESLDPGIATETISSNLIHALNEPLVNFGPQPQSKALPAAAQSWTVKGPVVTINLRRDLRWTTGQPVTAQDYVWSWLRAISPELGGDYAYQFFGIKGAEAYNGCDPKGANCNALRSQVGISAPSKYSVRVQLVGPQAWFIQQLNHTTFIPVHRATVEKYGDKWTEPGNIVTFGPFKLSAWTHDASVTLVKNPKWRNAKSVKLNKITFTMITDQATAENAYAAGNADINEQDLPPALVSKWKKNPEYKKFGTLGTYFYEFNIKNIPDVNQRRAMAFAIDRKAIVTYITQAGQVPARGMTPIATPGGKEILQKSTFLPATAKMAQAKAFMAKAKNPKRNINLYFNTSTAHAAIATAVQAFWKELGITTTLKNMDFAQYLDFLGPPPDSDVDVARLGWLYDYPDAYNGLEMWGCDSGNNHTNWCSKKFDALLKKMARTPNDAVRVKLYQQAESMLTSSTGALPFMPIYWYVNLALVKPNVQGYNKDLIDRTDYTKVSLR
jgi:oligopeptide transport system substrate-binding protein